MSPQWCEACGRDGSKLERHHLAGVYNIATAFIPVHRHCHKILTESQRISGVVLHRRAQRGPTDRAYAMIAGFAGWISVVRNGTAPIDRNLRAAGQLLAAIRERENLPGYGRRFGPDPIRTDRRNSPWRRRRVRPVTQPTVFVRALAGQLRAAVGELTGGDLAVTAIGSHLDRIESQPAQYANRWARMDVQTVRTDEETLGRAVRALIDVTRGTIEVEEAQERVRPLRAVIERWLGGGE